MDAIEIQELEVFYRVGVPEAERAHPQRLLLCVRMELDFTKAAQSDALEETVDYYSVSQHLLGFGSGRSWRLIEKLAVDLAEFLLARFKLRRVEVEVRKFIIPEAGHVAVRVMRPH
jgi:7,8-dihydroneopterin aldolase/epimerase/oxygenase